MPDSTTVTSGWFHIQRSDHSTAERFLSLFAYAKFLQKRWQSAKKKCLDAISNLQETGWLKQFSLPA
jgi:hypothetical protein